MKQNLFVKQLLIVLLAIVGTIPTWGETASFDFQVVEMATQLGVSAPSTASTGSSIAGKSVTVSPITISFTNGTSNTPMFWKTSSAFEARVYVGATVTVSASSGYKITSIVSTGSNLTDGGATKYWDTNKPANWSSVSGETSVVFSCIKSTPSFKTITITYESTGSGKTSVSLGWSAANYPATIGGANSFPTLTVDPEAARTGVSYSSTNTSVATINATTGEISLVAPGSTTIKASRAEDATYRAASEVSYALTVNAAVVERAVTWYVNSEEYTAGSPTTRVNDGSKVTTLPTEPSAPDGCSGKVFVGWTNAKIETGTDTAPAVLFKDAANAPIVTGGDAKYYAVFADEN